MHTNEPRTEHESAADTEPTISVAHILNILEANIRLILLLMTGVALLYTILAILLYLLTPAQRTTSQPFQLIFAGAAKGHYPNGLTFSPVEVVSAPILLKVYQRNDLGRFLTLNDFSRSMFVLESNPAYEALAREYEARLSDTKLSPVDRERIQREFELKREAITKNEFSINFQRTSTNSRVPESTVRAVLVDTLNVWADDAVNQQHALDYRVAVLSPNVVDSTIPDADYVAQIIILRSQITLAIGNIEELFKLPGAEMIKTPGDHLSLVEIRIRLDELMRFRLEPLMTLVATKNLISDPVISQRFVQGQLDYDQRELESLTAHANAYRDALEVYAQRPKDSGTPTAAKEGEKPGETLVLNDSFIDKIVDLTTRSTDIPYRQSLADDYRMAALATIPVRAAVEYDKQILEQLRSARGGGSPGDAESFKASVTAIRAEVRRLITKTNEIYQIESSNLRPSSQLFSMTAPPATRIERSRSLPALGLAGVAVLLIAFVLIILGILLQHSMREDEEAQHRESPSAAA